MTIERVSTDSWGRQILKNTKTGELYVVVDHVPHTMTREYGEPIAPVHFYRYFITVDHPDGHNRRVLKRSWATEAEAKRHLAATLKVNSAENLKSAGYVNPRVKKIETYWHGDPRYTVY